MTYNLKLKSTYVKYYDDHTGEENEIKLVTHNSNDARIFYKTDYNTYISNAINYIIGTFAWANKIRNRPQSHVYISNKNLAKNIGCSYGHASYIMDQLKEIFNLVVTNERGRSKAREVKLSKTLIDFTQIYSDEQLSEFIDNHNISEENIFAVQQVYRYLGWGITPNKLKPSQREIRREYMSDEERRNFWHYAATSHYKVGTRVKKIEENVQLLSEQQQKQFEHLKKVIKPGKKLIKYWHNILIKLQQVISWLTRTKENVTEQEQTTSVNNENLNKESSVAHEAATAEHQKKPEDIRTVAQKLQFMAKVIMSWNERAERNNLPPVKRLTDERYNSLLAIMEEYNESEILQALNRIEYIHQGSDYDHKFTFSRFMTPDRILYALEYDKDSLNAITVDVMDQVTNNFNLQRQYSALPEFNSINQVNLFIREQI